VEVAVSGRSPALADACRWILGARGKIVGIAAPEGAGEGSRESHPPSNQSSVLGTYGNTDTRSGCDIEQ